YFVSFTQNGNFNKAFYNTAGQFVYSLKYSNGDALPTNILVSVNKNFSGSKIIGVTEVGTQSNTVYNIKLSKGDKLYTLDVLPDGTVTQQETFDTNGVNIASV